MKKRPIKRTNHQLVRHHRRQVIDPATWQLLKHIVIGLVFFAILISLVVGIWYGTRIETLTIQNITVEGGQTISHFDVKMIADDVLAGSYLALIPRRFVWTYPQAELMAAISAINRVKDPVFERVSGTELKIIVDEFIPVALWCKEKLENDCLFIDKDGVAFASAPQLNGGSLYRFFTLGTEPSIKKVFSAEISLGQIIDLADALESDFLLPVTKIEIDAVGDVFFQVVGGGEIKTTLTQTVTTTLENLALVLSAPDFKDIAPGTFQYIDLRFGNKVFVNDTLPVIATTTAENNISLDSPFAE